MALARLARRTGSSGSITSSGCSSSARGGRTATALEPARAAGAGGVGRARSCCGRQRRRRGFANSFRVPLSIPGEVLLEPQGWAVSAELGSTRPARSSGHRRPGPAGRLTVAVAAEPLALPLAVRSRRPGDRFRPLGLRGAGRSCRISRGSQNCPGKRDSLPLVVDRRRPDRMGRGQSVAEDFRVTEPSQGVILLKARRLGGQG